VENTIDNIIYMAAIAYILIALLFFVALVQWLWPLADEALRKLALKHKDLSIKHITREQRRRTSTQRRTL
jgi:hypothetical protein